MKEDDEFFNQFIIQNDDNKKDFMNEAQEKKIEDNNMQGWGSWAGDSKSINTREFLKKKRFLMKQGKDEKSQNLSVKINNSHDKKVIFIYLVFKLSG